MLAAVGDVDCQYTSTIGENTNELTHCAALRNWQDFDAKGRGDGTACGHHSNSLSEQIAAQVADESANILYPGECTDSPQSLPPPSALQNIKRSLQPGPVTTPPSHQRSSSSIYYAAAWGSPYATPSPKRSTVKTRRSVKVTSTPRTAGYHRSERGNWLSDDSADNGGTRRSASVAHSSGDSWLDLHSDYEDAGLTTISNTSASIRQSSQFEGEISPSSRGDHQGRDIADSVNQVHMDRAAEIGLKRQSTVRVTMPESAAEGAFDDLDPFPKHFPEKTSPKTDMTEATKLSQSDPADPTPPSNRRPSATTGASFQRPRKRVMWKGKTCTIALPLDDGRGKKTLLTPADVAVRLKQWQNEGWDTDGFKPNSSPNGEHFGGQSRRLYPDPVDVMNERSRRQFRVGVPNQAEWDAYVNRLKEEKLRALGVSLNEDDHPRSTQSPFPSSVSRTSSRLAGKSISPSVPSSSVASNIPLSVSRSFSPGFQASNTSSRKGSIVSFSPQFVPPQASMHRSNKSMAYPSTDPRMTSPLNPYASHGTPPLQPRVFSPSGYFAQRSDRLSPSVPGVPQSLGQALSSVPPLYEEKNGSWSHATPPQMNQHRASQSHFAPSPNDQKSYTQTPSFDRFDAQSTQPSDNLEIVHPAPQGHQRNISEVLQKEVDAAEAAIQKGQQLANANVAAAPVNGTQSSRRSEHPASQRIGRNGTDANNSHFQRPLSEVADPGMISVPRAINKSISHISQSSSSQILSFPDRTMSASQNSNQGLLSQSANPSRGHSARSSVSRLNVEAKEFKFDPKSKFSSSNFNLNGDSFQMSDAVPPYGNSTHKAIVPKSTSGVAKLNAAAPSFTPSRPPKSDFKFNSASFNVDAPDFNPRGSISQNTIEQKIDQDSADAAEKIFTNVTIDATSKAARRGKVSKALPIKQPEDEERTEDDSDPRVQIPVAPRKRARVQDQNGEENGLYATKTAVQAGSMELKSSETMTSPQSVLSGSEDVIRSSSPDTSSIDAVSGDGHKDSNREEFSVEATPVPPEASASFSEPGSNVAQDAREKASPFISEENVARPAKTEDTNSVDGVGGRPSKKTLSPLPLSNGTIDKSSNVSNQASKPRKPVGLMGSRFAVSPPPAARPAPAAPAENLPREPLPQPPPPGPAVVPSSLKPLVEDEEETQGQNQEAVPEKKDEKEIPEQAQDGVSEHRKEETAEQSREEVAHQGEEGTPEQGQEEILQEGPEEIANQSEEDNSERSQEEIQEQGEEVLPEESQAESDNTGQDEQDGATAEESMLPAGSLDEVEHNAPISDILSPGSTNLEDRDATVPTYDEIDAVMKQLEDNSDLGVERLGTPPTLSSIPTGGLFLNPAINIRSDAPSPSPRRTQITQESQHEAKRAKMRLLQSPFDIDLNSPEMGMDQIGATDASDWNDVLSVADEGKFESRRPFFDTHVNSLVGNILEDRLGPLERSLQTIQHSIALLSTQRPSSRQKIGTSDDMKQSDADDEDDDLRSWNKGMRPARSPLMQKDRKGDIVKKAVMEALAAHRLESSLSSGIDQSALEELLSEVKSLKESSMSTQRPEEIKAIVGEVISTHPRLRGKRVQEDHEAGASHKFKLQIDGLESMLKIANERAEEEYRSRRKLEDDLAERDRQLSIMAEEAAQYREASEEAEASLRTYYEEKESIQELEQSNSTLSLKNAALETTLDEYRLSHDQWRVDMEDERKRNRDLKAVLQALRREVEENAQSKQSLRAKLERLQGDMADVMEKVAHDQASWIRKEHELSARSKEMEAEIHREARIRQKMELELDELEKEHKGLSKFRDAYEAAQKENDRLDALVAQLRQESRTHEHAAHRLEMEVTRVRESTEEEASRAQSKHEHEIGLLKSQQASDCANLEAQIGLLKSQSASDCANLEAQVSRLQAQLQHAEDDMDEIKAKHENHLSEQEDRHGRALHEANESKEAALTEQRRSHEKALNDLRERHARALHNASDDKHRLEAHLNQKLALSSDKVQHLEEIVKDLQERLEITSSAARAAAQAAASKGVAEADLSPVPASTAASMPLAKGSNIPEKISPQALRESIMVLQDQLQNREQTIESLEAQLAKVDRDAPAKLKERDSEITWLRELLDVRVDDLGEIIHVLSEHDYDREAVRDAVIRLKTSLQMEQQERERAVQGSSGVFSSITSLSNLTQTPRALPMAAAAAWGNWRKARDTSRGRKSDLVNSNDQTPSRSSTSPQSFLSGLLTPPSTNQRSSTPPIPSAPPTLGRKTSSEARPLRAYNGQARSMSARQAEKRPLRRQASDEAPPTMSSQPEEQDAPSTPPLMRNSSYDQDADARGLNINDVDDDASLVGSATEGGGSSLGEIFKESAH